MIKYISFTEVPVLRNFPLNIFAFVLDKIFALDWFNEKFNQLMQKNNNQMSASFAGFVELLDIKMSFDSKYVIPASGPVLVVATHGWEFVDVIFLLAIITRIRGDVKFIADASLSVFKIFRENCFFISGDSPVRRYESLVQYLASGQTLCTFSLAWDKKASNKNQSFKIKYNKPLTPLVYNLLKDTHASILPINLGFKNTLSRRFFVRLEEIMLKFGFVKFVYYLGGFYGLFAFRTLRSLRGKTIPVNVGELTTEAPPKLSRPAATKWLANLLKLNVVD